MPAAELILDTLRLRGPRAREALADGWRRVPPRGLAALAQYEGAEPWVLRSLHETGCEAVAPAEFVAAVRGRTRLIAARNLLVDEEALRIVDRLQRAGIPFVLLKGSARHALASRYPFIDARATVDVDLLLPAAAAQAVWQELYDDGYRRVWESQPTYHLAALAGPGRVAVELHTALADGMQPDVAWGRVAADAVEVEWNGRLVRVPGATELLWHGMAHAVRADGPRGWRLRYFLDGASVLAATDGIDWETVRQRLAAGEVPHRLARGWLVVAAQLAGVPLPDDLSREALLFDLPRAVRWRLAVLSRRDDAGLGARLLEEGTRCELGAPVATGAPGAGPWKNARRWLGGRAARVMYRLWRARQGRGNGA